MDKLTEYIIIKNLIKETNPELEGEELHEIVITSVAVLGLGAVFALIGFAAFLGEVAELTIAIFKRGSYTCSLKYKNNDIPSSAYYNRCVCKVKLDIFTKLQKTLNSKKGKCIKEKNPQLCKQKIELAITKLKDKIIKEKGKLVKAEASIKKSKLTKH